MTFDVIEGSSDFARVESSQRALGLSRAMRVHLLPTLKGRIAGAALAASRAGDLVEEDGLTANVAFAVRDRYQNQGVGTELLSNLTQLARKQGLVGFTAEVLKENEPMLRVFEKMRFPIETSSAGECYEFRISLK